MKENEKIEITDGLLIAYVNEELESSQMQQISDWINASSENSSHFESIKKAWKITGEVEPKPVVVDTNLAWENVMGQIDDEAGKVVPLNAKRNKRVFWSAAAMIIILFGIFSVLKLTGTDTKNVTIVAQNSGLVDHLSDGSVVTLNANSSIVYPEKFDADERRINLTGEAFFDIERNEEKPFIIDLPEEAYVKVLGTSFNIKAIEGDSTIEVFVKTGRVEFGKPTSKIELTKGEKGILDLKSGKVYKKTGETAGVKELYWMEEELRFESIPLHEVLTILNDIFEEEVVLGCEAFKNERQRSVHKGESLEEILTVVADSQGLILVEKTDENGKQIILNCNDR